MSKEVIGGAVIHYVSGEKEELVFARDDASSEVQQRAFDRIQAANRTFNNLFDLFWNNRDGRLYSTDYDTFMHQTAGDWK